MWLDHDSDVDCLYVHFEDQPESSHSAIPDDGAILDYQEDRLVGLMVLEASRR